MVILTMQRGTGPTETLPCGREDVEELELVEPGPLDGCSSAADGGQMPPEVNGHAGGGGDGAAAGGGNNGGEPVHPHT